MQASPAVYAPPLPGSRARGASCGQRPRSVEGRPGTPLRDVNSTYPFANLSDLRAWIDGNWTRAIDLARDER
jgi:hypothetical protein